MTEDIIVVSTPYVPGYRVTKSLGFTWGLVVRSRGIGGNAIAGLRTIFGGEIHGYTELAQSMTEVLAMGTAVLIEKDSAPATPVRLA